MNLRRVATQGTLHVLKNLLAEMPDGDISWVARHAIRGDRGAADVALDRLSLKIHHAHENKTYEPDTNGERLVLEQLAKFDVATVFDVGANVGEWSRIASAALPRATVHAFEIVPATYQVLKGNLQTLNNQVICNCFGLSDVSGLVPVHFSPANPMQSSVFDVGYEFEDTVMVEGRIETGDRYMADNGIEGIDVLKIDVEGLEKKVLDGFGDALHAGRIGLIQLEYGIHNILSHFLLKDMHDLLESYGFKLGKIYRTGVDFRDYTLADEDFVGPNYIACHESKPEWRAALSI